ncbi:MAG: glycosyltransferase family 2 protein [Fusobacteriaceae bacterium]
MENKNPKVTILIPVYNREKIIEETLECAMKQTYDDYEIVIVDNKSTDKTFEIIQKYADKNPKIKLFQNSQNLGPVRNWKRGIEESKGEYVKILWSDDQISKDFLESTVHILENDNQIGFIYSKTLIYDEDLEVEAYNFGESGKYEMIEFLKGASIGTKNTPVSPGCALFRKKDLEKNLLIHLENPKKLDFSKYGAGNDLLLFLLTYPEYKYFYYINETKSFFRAHKDSFSISNNLTEYYNYSILYFFEKNIELIELSELRDLFYTKLFFTNRYLVKEKQYKFIIRYILDKIVQKIIRKIKSK